LIIKRRFITENGLALGISVCCQLGYSASAW
jgi:hypothetical protein